MGLHTVQAANATQHRDRIVIITIIVVIIIIIEALFYFIIDLEFPLFFLLSSAALINKTYFNGVCGAGPVMILRLTDVREM